MIRKKALLAILILSLSSLDSIIPASAASPNATIGNLVGKWSYPKTIKIPKKDCGSFKATFTLGPRSLSEGTGGRVYQGLSLFALVNENTDPLATSTVKFVASSSKFPLTTFDDVWKDSMDPDIGETNKTVVIKFCKSDWQNSDGDFLGAISPGKTKIMMMIEKLNTVGTKIGQDRFESTVTFTK